MREQKPVLVDMWATWCKNCLVMDKTTLADPTVTNALDGYVKIKFQAEQPDEEPARAVMERFKARRPADLRHPASQPGACVQRSPVALQLRRRGFTYR